MEHENDETDWDLAKSGDGSAFASLFDRHRARVLRHCFAIVGNAADAEDALAVVFLEVWRRRASVRTVNGSILPWLLVTATNTAHNLTRASRRYQRLLQRLPEVEHVDDPALHIGEDDAEFALQSLSVNDQRVITVCVLEGLSEKHAAAVLGIPPGTVKSRLSRAKSRLATLVRQPPVAGSDLTEGAPHAY